MLKRLHSCKKKSDDGRYVHTIYITPGDNDEETEDIFLDIGIKLPNKSFYGNISHFPSLETNMPHFKHIVRRMTSDEYVHFGSAAFTTTNSPVILEGINADKVYIMTNRGTVDANINATSRVHIHAPDGKISANLNMTNYPGRGNTSVALTTSKSGLSSNIQLYSSTGVGGNFSVLTRNAHASTNIVVRSVPVDSTLRLNAFGSQGSVRTTLPPAYEGLLSVHAMKPIVHITRGVPDPAQKNRRREVVVAKGNSEDVHGRVWWGPPHDHSLGNVTLSAPGGQAVLDL
jgi:hypothetical protein